MVQYGPILRVLLHLMSINVIVAQNDEITILYNSHIELY